MTPVYDFVGKPITVGCHVAYPMRRRSRMWLTTLRVDDVAQTGETVVLSGRDSAGRIRRTRNTQNCIVVEIT